MEDVWKELSLASLEHHYSAAFAATTRPLTLQEFLASPINASKPEKTKVSQPQKKKLPLSNINPTETPASSSSNGLPSTDAAFCACSKRQGGPSGDDNANDRKKYRLMKNRESAARSRARKQAYTYELELEVAHLMEENSKLRKQQEQVQLCAAALGDQPQKKQKLHRTLTAPF